MGIYVERLDAKGNTVSIERIGDPFFLMGNVQIEGLDKPSPSDELSQATKDFIKRVLGCEYEVGNLQNEEVKRVLDILGKVAPCMVNGYFVGPYSVFQHPLASPVRGRFCDGFWEDPRIALRATSQPSIFDDTVKRTTEIFEGILMGKIFLLHYPGTTLAPSQSSLSVGDYIAQNFLIHTDSPKKVLEIGTGGGVITLSMMQSADKKTDFTATDIDESVLNIAELNAKIGGFDFSRVSFIQSNLFQSIHPNAKFDIIVSNPPFYDTQGALQVIENPRFAGKVPMRAIDGGERGLDFYKKILELGRGFINTGGKFVFQTSPKISQEVLELGRNILGSDCIDSYCVKEGKRTQGKGIIVVFEIA